MISSFIWSDGIWNRGQKHGQTENFSRKYIDPTDLINIIVYEFHSFTVL